MSGINKKEYSKETDEIKAFHRTRRMFCIYDNQLRIASKNLPYSHAAWFQNEKWMTDKNDEIMNNAPRGMVNEKGDIYFYVGYNFEINNNIESIFFAHLAELAKKLDLDTSAQIFGGLIKSKPGTIWPPIKSYGKIADIIK